MQVNPSPKEPENRELTYCSRDYPTPPLLQRSAFPYKGTFSKSHCPNPARSTRQPLPLELLKKHRLEFRNNGHNSES